MVAFGFAISIGVSAFGLLIENRHAFVTKVHQIEAMAKDANMSKTYENCLYFGQNRTNFSAFCHDSVCWTVLRFARYTPRQEKCIGNRVLVDATFEASRNNHKKNLLKTFRHSEELRGHPSGILKGGGELSGPDG